MRVKGSAKATEQTEDLEPDVLETPAPDPVAEPPAEDEPPKPKTKVKETKDEPAPKPSSVMRAIQNADDMALREYLESIGPEGSFRVAIIRSEPRMIRVDGKDYKVEGHLGTYGEPLDEERIAEMHGGGTYHLRITRKGPTGSFNYFGNRTIKIAGDPKITNLPTNTKEQPAPAPAAPAESGGVVKEVMGILKHELDRSRDAKAPGLDPALAAMIAQMREDMRASQAEAAELRRALLAAQTAKPPEDPIKDKLLSSLVDGQSGHVEALRLRHEAEIRQLKESAVQDQKRLEDRHDRAVSEMRQSHDLALATLRQGYEREIAAIKHAHDVSAMATKAGSDVQNETLKADIKRLERQIETQERELERLREKKDKSIIEQIKEIKILKEAVADEGGEGKGTFQQIVEAAASPAAGEVIGKIASRFGGGPPQGQAVQAQAVATQARPPRVVKDPATGQRYVQAGDKLVPVKPAPKVIATEDGTQIQAPAVDPDAVKTLVSYLESAYSAGTDPALVAQSGRSFVPDEVMAWVQEQDTEKTSGVELFLAKVAKIPASSPLASQGGRNWLRKVGKALIGGAG